jgi:hypothetical protein
MRITFNENEKKVLTELLDNALKATGIKSLEAILILNSKINSGEESIELEENEIVALFEVFDVVVRKEGLSISGTIAHFVNLIGQAETEVEEEEKSG